MRLRLLTVAGTMALVLAAPSAALAHHGRGHHHHKAKARHAKFRFEHVGASGVSAPSTSPSNPTPPPTTTPESAGKVASYEKEVLTITLNDGSTVSGKVTSETRIECVSATPATSTEPGEEGPGDDNGPGDDQSRGDMSESGKGEGDHKDGGDDGDDEGAIAEPPCDTSLLVAGAVVRSAELRIGPSGDEFEQVTLVR